VQNKFSCKRRSRQINNATAKMNHSTFFGIKRV